jgi:oxygen-independent coproporphyrinogen-3 oxidase
VDDRLRGRIIEALMCDFAVSSDELIAGYGADELGLRRMFREAAEGFPGMVDISADGFSILKRGRPLTRIIARAFDAYDMAKAGHSHAM